MLVEANASPSCIGVIAWMHTFSPAKMWISGLAALQRPFLHLHTQYNRDLPWAEIDMDFMNLNQSAHGDREFAFMETRMGLVRKTVVGHWSEPGVRERIGAWARAAAGWREAHHLTVARFGDNMRQVAVTEGDKVEAQLRLGVTVSGYGVGDLVESVNAVSNGEVDRLVASTRRTTTSRPSFAPAGSGASPSATRRGSRPGCGRSSSALGARAFTDTFEDLHGLKQLPGIAVQRLMADGYGFGGEGDWKTAALVRIDEGDGRRASPAARRSWRTTPTTSRPAAQKMLGAHMLEVCPSIAGGRPSCEIHPLSIGGRDDPVRLVFTAPPGPGGHRGDARPRRPLPARR